MFFDLVYHLIFLYVIHNIGSIFHEILCSIWTVINDNKTTKRVIQ